MLNPCSNSSVSRLDLSKKNCLVKPIVSPAKLVWMTALRVLQLVVLLDVAVVYVYLQVVHAASDRGKILHVKRPWSVSKRTYIV